MSEQQDWRPSASLDLLRLRARVLQRMRAFFDQRGVMEVDTPVLSAAASTDPYLQSFVCDYQAIGSSGEPTSPLYLQTSPEFAMKRLLAAGAGPIYQLCKAFRNGEVGRRHNPEFTMLEWYRPGFDHHALMDEVEALLQEVVLLGGVETQAIAIERVSYGEVFLHHTGIDPHRADVPQLRQYCQAVGLEAPLDSQDGVDDWLMFVMAHCIEPKLSPEPLFVYDFPVGQAMLARTAVREDGVSVAQRFELYAAGLELANGFYELTDAIEQRHRFDADMQKRTALGLPLVPMDEQLLAALMFGLPECAGVALGVDRLLLFLAKAQRIQEVIAFPVQNST